MTTDTRRCAISLLDGPDDDDRHAALRDFDVMIRSMGATWTADTRRHAIRRHDLLDGPDDDDRQGALRDGNLRSGAMTVIDLR